MWRRVLRAELRELWYKGLISTEDKSKLQEAGGYSSNQAMLKHINTDNGFIKTEIQQALMKMYSIEEFNAMYYMAFNRPFCNIGAKNVQLIQELKKALASIIEVL